MATSLVHPLDKLHKQGCPMHGWCSWHDVKQKRDARVYQGLPHMPTNVDFFFFLSCLGAAMYCCAGLGSLFSQLLITNQKLTLHALKCMGLYSCMV